MENSVYRRMYYTLENNCEDGTLLHNCISSQLVLLSAKESELLGKLPMLFQCEMVPLIEAGFLVPVDFDEHAVVNQLRAVLRAIQDTRYITSYTIEPTTYCNARCFYCYEYGFQHVHMSTEIADQLIEYMIDHSGGNPLSILWFGGEPTVNAGMIDYICTQLKAKNAVFTSRMISNAYLFDEDMVRNAKGLWNLREIQITLDGTEDVYNRTKDYIGTLMESPYRRVLRNIHLLTSVGIKVKIRMNLSNSNYTDLKVLVKKLISEFSDASCIMVYVHALYENSGRIPMKYTEEERIISSLRVNELNDLLRENHFAGISTKLPNLRINQCMVDNDACVVVLPDGKLVKCEHHNGDGNAIGTLETGITAHELITTFHKYVEFPECIECPRYPSCLYVNDCFLATRCDSVLREYDHQLARMVMLNQFRIFKGGLSQ